MSKVAKNMPKPAAVAIRAVRHGFASSLDVAAFLGLTAFLGLAAFLGLWVS